MIRSHPKIRRSIPPDFLLRLRLNRLLSAADWRPPEMPPTAVLIVRHLQDPLPGKLVTGPHTVRVSQAWETAVVRKLDALYQSAARPSLGKVPLSAQAVLFADEGELLACLALDRMRGPAVDHWWWQALRRARPTLFTKTITTMLQDQPRLIPTVVVHWHRWGKWEKITEKFRVEQVAALLNTICQTNHMPVMPLFSAAGHNKPTQKTVDRSIAPPWEQSLSAMAVPFTKSPAHTCLLGLSLILIHRPSAITTPSFQQNLHEWWQAQTFLADRPHHKPSVRTTLPKLTRIQKTIHEKSADVDDVRDNENRPIPVQLTSALTPGIQSLPIDSGEPPRAVSSSMEADTDEQQQTAMPRTPDPGDEPTVLSANKRAETHVSFEDGVQTQLGGIFYLINLMVQRDIPACFEDSWALASQVGAWGILELLARGLLDTSDLQLQYDPVWMVLAELDGRSGSQLPGHNYTPPSLTDTDSAIDPTPWLASIHPILCQWLAQILPNLRTDLVTALNLKETDDLVDTLLLVNGRLHISNSHVDLILPLDAVSMPVRLVGLDFDPGWQPAFGRVIQFHFE